MKPEVVSVGVLIVTLIIDRTLELSGPVDGLLLRRLRCHCVYSALQSLKLAYEIKYGCLADVS